MLYVFIRLLKQMVITLQLKHLYYPFTQTHLEYGLFAWKTAVTIHVKHLQAIQNLLSWSTTSHGNTTRNGTVTLRYWT